MLGESWNSGVGEDVLIRESCSIAMKASGDASLPFVLHEKGWYESVAFFAFPGSWEVEEWRGSPTKIDPILFPSLRCLGSDESALVHGAFLHRFRALLSTPTFERQVHKAVSERKWIVFTGHSAGGAIATLATVWLLEQFRKSEDCNQNLPLCLTFGSPLVGDGIFGHALGREKWSNCFVNFVMRYDIVPRITFSPINSIEQDFQAILHLLNPKSSFLVTESIGKSQQAVSFFTTVLRNACSVSSRRACLDMGCTNMLLEEVTGFIQLCPYRPVGTYLFSTGNGRLVRVNNSDAVLFLLFYCLQLASDQELTEVACRSLKEHLAYGSELQESLEMQDIVFLDQLEHLPLSSDDGFCYGMQSFNMALRDLGLSMEARLCLRAAIESKMQQQRNKAKIDANHGKIQEALNSLRRYREMCEIREVGYYDAFKLQRDNEDFNANLKRLELTGYMDEIVEMLKRYELPDDFECQTEWVKLGTNFRRLVEPLDIANYYRHFKNEDSGPYLVKGRPKRYKCTQRWFEQARRMTPWSSSDSCFWAKVEELSACTANGTPFEEIRGRVLELEKELLKWVAGGELGRDVFLESSTFARWWKRLPQQHRLSSGIAKLMDGENKCASF